MRLLTTFALASAAIAAPAADSCTSDSSQSANFTISDFTFDGVATYSTPSHLATSEGTVSFNLKVSPIKKAIHCSAATTGTYPTYFDGKTWYECKDSDKLSASFKYDVETGVVKVKTHWYCSDSSWDASGKATIESEDECDTNIKKNKHWSLENPGKYYEQVSTSCFDNKVIFKPTKISGVA